MRPNEKPATLGNVAGVGGESSMGSKLDHKNTTPRGAWTDYPAYCRADFLRLGAERIDSCTLPRIVLVNIIAGRVLFHVSGDRSIRVTSLSQAIADGDLIDGLSPRDALQLGRAWGRRDG